MCAQEVHTYNKRIELSESMLYIAENIFILTLTNIRVRRNKLNFLGSILLRYG